jgi:ribosome maturation factor RimP
VSLNRVSQIAVLTDLIAPALDSLGLELFDLEIVGAGRTRTLRVTVERRDHEPSSGRPAVGSGVDLDEIAAASQAIAPLLDRDATLNGSYLLEVSSPGVERPLRRPEHFRRAIGEIVSVKYRTDTDAQRIRGALVEVDDDACVVDVDGEPRRIAFADIADARTVFEWGPSPRPNQRGRAKERSRS